MKYEWDENKNIANKQKHDGIGFETAVRVFLDNKRIEFFDAKHSTLAEVIGLVFDVLFVVYTERKESIRII